MYQNVPYKRVFVTIDLDAIVFNMESMKQNIKPGTEMMGVVKADGYGHGAVPVAKAMDPYVWGYAAATSEEALQLRAHGITKPVLVLSPVHPSEFQELIREGIRITVFRGIRPWQDSQYPHRSGHWYEPDRCDPR